ncbi:MAG: hypothetical protein H7A22_09565 [Spirochaetales bacterium]|nr:hypothetical protein [Spirochaetales bacterium]
MPAKHKGDIEMYFVNGSALQRDGLRARRMQSFSVAIVSSKAESVTMGPSRAFHRR